MILYLRAEGQLKNIEADDRGSVSMVNTTVGETAYNETAPELVVLDTNVTTTAESTTSTSETEATTTETVEKTSKKTAAATKDSPAPAATTAAAAKTTTAAPTTTTKATTAATQPASATQYNDNDGDWVSGWD